MQPTIEIQDFTHLTCTNLMIKLKIKLKHLTSDQPLHFYSTREQRDNIKGPFSKKDFHFSTVKVDNNKYHISIIKAK